MSYEAQRMHILDRIESGQISAEEGLMLLQALISDQPHVEDDGDEVDVIRSSSNEIPQPQTAHAPMPVVEPEVMPTQPAALPPETEKWRRFWIIPLWIGVAILLVGSALMYWALQAAGMSFWVALASIPFLIGLLLIIFAWQSRTTPWIHLRVTQPGGEKPERIAFSFPIPIRPTMWFFRTFGGKIPKIQEISLDKILFAVDQSANAENPIYIQVDEGNKGEKVEIYIG